MRPRIIRSVGGVFVRQVYTLAIGLFTSIMFARFLGPLGNGVYATALLVPLLLVSLFNLGLGSAAVFLVNAGVVGLGQARSTTLHLWKIVCAVILPIAAILIRFFGEQFLPNIDPPLLYLAAILFPFLLLNTLYCGLLQTAEDFRSYNLVLATTPTITCVVGIFAVGLLKGGSTGALIAVLIANIAACGVAQARLRPHFKGLDGHRTVMVRPFLTYGWKSSAADSIQFINYRADLYFVNFFVGAEGAGIYALAVSLCEKLWLAAEAMTAVLFPRFARLGNDSRRLLLVAVLLAVCISTLGAIALAVAAHMLIGPLFGQAFQESSRAIDWLLPGVVAICFGKIITTFLAARGKIGANLVASIAGVIVNVSSNLYLTPRYGIVGAAMATSLGYFVLVGVVIFAASREIRSIKSSSPSENARLQDTFESVDVPASFP